MTPGRRALLLLLASLAISGSVRAGAARAVATAVLSDSAPAYEETLTVLRETLQRQAPGLNLSVIDWREAASLSGRQPVVTIGTQAAAAVSKSGYRGPVLHTMVPRSSFQQLDAAPPGQVSAIFIDQPAERQIALIRQALPEWHRVALLAGPESAELARELAAAAREQHLVPAVERASADEDLYAALQKLLVEPAVLIATPDPALFNSYTIQNILLTAYRQRSPVIGFSPAYVRAGAILAVYSTPRQIATHAAEIVLALLAGDRLPAPRSCQYFEVASNAHVARSLGITLDTAEQIRERLVSLEEAGR